LGEDGNTCWSLGFVVFTSILLLCSFSTYLASKLGFVDRKIQSHRCWFNKIVRFFNALYNLLFIPRGFTVPWGPPLSPSLPPSLSLSLYIYIYIYIYIMITFIIMCLLDFFHIAFYFIKNYIIILMKYKHVSSNSGGKSGTCPTLMKWIIFRNFFFLWILRRH